MRPRLKEGLTSSAASSSTIILPPPFPLSPPPTEGTTLTTTGFAATSPNTLLTGAAAADAGLEGTPPIGVGLDGGPRLSLYTAPCPTGFLVSAAKWGLGAGRSWMLMSARFSTSLVRVAKLSVLSVSWRNVAPGEMLQIKRPTEDPPRVSCRIRVNLESLRSR